MAKFILRLSNTGGERNPLNWDAIVQPFGDTLKIVERTESMVLIEGEESIGKKIAEDNEGVKYFEEKTYPLPDERASIA